MSPGEELALVRERSKQLLGTRSRAEVAAAVARLGSGRWTKVDLERELGARPIPPSLLHKELSVLQRWGLVVRHGRDVGGHLRYSRRGFDAFWTAMRALARADLPDEREGVIPLRAGGPRRRRRS